MTFVITTEAVVITKGAKLESDIKLHKVKLGGVWGGWTGQKFIHFRLKEENL